MGSNEPLGEQQVPDTIDLDADAQRLQYATTHLKGHLEGKEHLGRGREG